MTKRNVFNLTLIGNGETIQIHASYTGEPSFVLDAGMALVETLSGEDSVTETLGAATLPAPVWVQ